MDGMLNFEKIGFSSYFAYYFSSIYLNDFPT